MKCANRSGCVAICLFCVGEHPLQHPAIMAIAPFPHRYVVALENDKLVAAPRPEIPAGAPPQFGGTDTVWSPEDLLVASALLCLKTTFDAYARRASLPVVEWHGTGTATLAKAPGGPTFTSIDLDVAVVTAPGDEARATDLIGQAERHCIISHALNVPIHVSVTATASPVSAAG